MAKSDFGFHHRRRIEYAEIDAQGVVFNSHYLTFFDTAIYEYLRELGFDAMVYPEETGHDFHTVRAVVEFHRPIRFGEEIDVHMRVARTGRSSLSFAAEIYRRDGDDRLTSGEVVWVNADQATGRSAPLPPDLVERIRRREGDRVGSTEQGS